MQPLSMYIDIIDYYRYCYYLTIILQISIIIYHATMIINYYQPLLLTLINHGNHNHYINRG